MVLFIVFIDDIDEGIGNTGHKFADNTKLVARVGLEDDRERLRQDLIVFCSSGQRICRFF